MLTFSTAEILAPYHTDAYGTVKQRKLVLPSYF